jgi:hypothetical protein
MQTLFSDPDNEMGLQNRLLCEAGAMAEAALSRGKEVPPKVVTTIEAARQAHSDNQPIPEALLADLVTAHHTLAGLIAPALPRTMRLLQEDARNANRFLRVLGPVSLVRHLMLAGVASLVLFVATCASELTDDPPKPPKPPKEKSEAIKSTTDSQSVGAKQTGTSNQTVTAAQTSASNQTGTSDQTAPAVSAANKGASNTPHRTIMNMESDVLVMNVLMWIGAAGIGASFVCLYKANRYVTEGTFDPMYVGSYWIRFFLGLISGLMLAVTVNGDLFKDNTLLEPHVIRVPLAIVGGFSAELFYTFLSRLVEACKSLFQGSVDEAIKSQVTREKARLAALQMQQQMQHAADLMKLQQSIGGTTTPEEIKKQLADLTNQILPSRPADSLSPVAPPKPPPVAPPNTVPAPNPAAPLNPVLLPKPAGS